MNKLKYIAVIFQKISDLLDQWLEGKMLGYEIVEVKEKGFSLKIIR